MRRVLVFSLVMTLSGAGAAFAAGAQAPKPASVSGVADNAAGAPLANTTVRLRNVTSGTVSASTTSNAAGQFEFAVAEPGNYVIEVVNAAGQIVGTSATIAVSAGATIAGITVRGPAAAAAAAANASKPFFTSTAGIVTAAATAAAVVGVTVAAGQDTASPSK